MHPPPYWIRRGSTMRGRNSLKTSSSVSPRPQRSGRLIPATPGQQPIAGTAGLGQVRSRRYFPKDGLTLADVMEDPDSLISMEGRIEAKIEVIIAPLLEPAKVVANARPAPSKPASTLPLNDLMNDLRIVSTESRASLFGTSKSPPCSRSSWSNGLRHL